MAVHRRRPGPDRASDRRWSVYFGADDGWIYCLEAATGKPVWTFRAARGGPVHRQRPGDGPLAGALGRAGGRRRGLLHRGMWNNEGVYVYALKADTGG